MLWGGWWAIGWWFVVAVLLALVGLSHLVACGVCGFSSFVVCDFGAVGFVTIVGLRVCSGCCSWACLVLLFAFLLSGGLLAGVVAGLYGCSGVAFCCL